MNATAYQQALQLLEEPVMLDTEQLVSQAFILGIGFSFIRPTVSRNKTTLHVLPSTKLRGVRATPQEIALIKATWQGVHDRAAEIVLYLMDHESCLSWADGGGYSVHHYPTPLRKQRLPCNVTASIVEPPKKLPPKHRKCAKKCHGQQVRRELPVVSHDEVLPMLQGTPSLPADTSKSHPEAMPPSVSAPSVETIPQPWAVGKLFYGDTRDKHGEPDNTPPMDIRWLMIFHHRFTVSGVPLLITPRDAISPDDWPADLSERARKLGLHGVITTEGRLIVMGKSAISKAALQLGEEVRRWREKHRPRGSWIRTDGMPFMPSWLKS